ncbi:MAG TPA: tRNA lysidine(34) synthetase TilS, partial [Amaricoccus sp.]|nr:tRNA lysidine(34) synthetase TilS [Amaricoccus sp.]
SQSRNAARRTPSSGRSQTTPSPPETATPTGPGGGDSVALLVMLAESGARTLRAVTVDHGLRPESAAEAAAVARLCAGLGITHRVLTWADPAGPGNLQDRARSARRRLIADWARAEGIGAVALGHTLDDQAETLLIRLARGSGVDGLSAMAAVSGGEGVVWLRPLLGVRRAALRDWLVARGLGWAEDASNADPRFERVRARAALPLIARLGLGPERLAATAAAMARAREALERATADLAARAVEAGPAGDLALDPGALAGAPAEIRLRLIAAALCWVGGARYRPRLARLEAALAAIEAGRVGHGLTLHGCVLRSRGGRVAIRREPAAAAPPAPIARGVWDGRWRLEGVPPAGDDLVIAAVGAAGLAALGDWRATGLAREALLTTPAVWRGGSLVAAPVVRPAAGFGFRRVSAIAPPWAPVMVR